MSWPGKAKAATLITVNVGWLVVPFLLGFLFFFSSSFSSSLHDVHFVPTAPHRPVVQALRTVPVRD